MSVTIDNDVYNIKLANFDKQNFINSEISNRNYPSGGLSMNFSFRPVNTKYTFMPTVAPLVKSVEPIVMILVLFSFRELVKCIFAGLLPM